MLNNNITNEIATNFINDIENLFKNKKIKVEEFAKSGTLNRYYVDNEDGTNRLATKLEIKKKANIVYREADNYYNENERLARDLLVILFTNDSKVKLRAKVKGDNYEDLKPCANALYKFGLLNIETMLDKYIAKQTEEKKYQKELSKLKDIHGQTKSTTAMLKEIVAEKVFEEEIGYKIAKDCLKYKQDILTKKQSKIVLDLYQRITFKETEINSLGIDGITEEEVDIIKKVYLFNDKEAKKEQTLYNLVDKIVLSGHCILKEKGLLQQLFQEYEDRENRLKYNGQKLEFAEYNVDLKSLPISGKYNDGDNIEINLNDVYASYTKYNEIEEAIMPLY